MTPNRKEKREPGIDGLSIRSSRLIREWLLLTNRGTLSGVLPARLVNDKRRKLKMSNRQMSFLVLGEQDELSK